MFTSTQLTKSAGPPLMPGQTRLYGRKSVKTESASKSLQDQKDENLETCEEWGIPVSEDDVRDEKPGHGGDEWWQGGGVTGLARDTINKNRFRPVLTEIVKDIENGAVRCIVTWSMDRLWRDVGLCDALINLFADYGVKLFDRNGPVDISTPDGKAKVRNTAIAAQHYREMCAVNSPRGILRSAKKGGNVNNANILGFRGGPRGAGLVFPQAAELAVVRRIFLLYDAGETRPDGTIIGPGNFDSIARLLTDEEYSWTLDLQKTRGAQRNEYTKGLIYGWQVRQVLTDPRYNGRQRYKRQEFDCPLYLVDGKPVIEDALWHRVQDKINSLKRTGNKGQQGHPLVGLLRCGLCGQGLHQKKSASVLKSGERKTAQYWKNTRSDEWSWCTHELPYIQVKNLDEYLDNVLAPLLVAELADRATSAQRNGARDNEARLKSALKEAERRYTDDLPGYMGKVTPQMLVMMEQKVVTEIKDLQARLREAERESRDDVDASRRDSLLSLASAPPEARRDAIRAAVRWVALLPSGEPREAVPGYSWGSRTRPATIPGWYVVCTAWGTLHTARIRRADTGETDHRQLIVEAAPLTDVYGTVAEFPEPENFARGLERAWKSRKYLYAPDEVLPGYRLGTLPYIAEFDLDDAEEKGTYETLMSGGDTLAHPEKPSQSQQSWSSHFDI